MQLIHYSSYSDLGSQRSQHIYVLQRSSPGVESCTPRQCLYTCQVAMPSSVLCVCVFRASGINLRYPQRAPPPKSTAPQSVFIQGESRLAVFSSSLFGGCIKGRNSKLSPSSTLIFTPARGRATLITCGDGEGGPHTRLGSCQQEVLKHKRISIILAPSLKHLMLLF